MVSYSMIISLIQDKDTANTFRRHDDLLSVVCGPSTCFEAPPAIAFLYPGWKARIGFYRSVELLPAGDSVFGVFCLVSVHV